MKKIKVKANGAGASEGMESVTAAFTKLLNPTVDLIILMQKYNEIYDAVHEFWIHYQQLGLLIEKPQMVHFAINSIKMLDGHEWNASWTAGVLLMANKDLYSQVIHAYELFINSFNYTILTQFVSTNKDILSDLFDKETLPSDLVALNPKKVFPTNFDAIINNPMFDRCLNTQPTNCPADNPTLLRCITLVNEIQLSTVYHKIEKKQEMMKLLSNIYYAGYKSIEAFFTPDISSHHIKEFVAQSLSSKNIMNNPRFKGVSSVVMKSLNNFETRFPRYYRSYVVSGDIMTIYTNFVKDITEVVSDSPHLKDEQSEALMIDIQKQLLSSIPSNVSSEYQPFINMVRKEVKKKEAVATAMSSLKDLHSKKN